ncbi:MAG: MlaD family protein [Bryobacteraceae bacterium]
MSTAFRLGAFIVGTLLVLAAGIFLIGSKEFLFSSTYTLRSDFQNVAGLADGAQVRVGGIPEGTVKHIVLPGRPDEKVSVLMNLQHATQDVLKKDSIASIKSEGLLGDKYVEIPFGSDEAERLKSGNTIASAPPRHHQGHHAECRRIRGQFEIHQHEDQPRTRDGRSAD